MHIAIIGAGRLGRSLHVLWERAGHRVTLVGRTTAPPADVRVITVPDASIPEVAASLVPGAPVLHCAGALSHHVLRPHRPAGTLHPLMTFPGPEVHLPELRDVPVAIGGDPEALELARQLALDLGADPFEVPGDRRLYHAAAVIAGNLSMVLIAEAARVLAAAGVPIEDAPRRLIPLALRSIQNASKSLQSTLTGPVARGETDTILSHREALAEHGLGDVTALYDALVQRAAVHVRAPEAEE